MSKYPLCVSCKWCVNTRDTLISRLFCIRPKYVCVHPNCLESPVDGTPEFANACYEVRKRSYMCYYDGRYYEPKDTVATLDNLHK